MAAFGDDRYAYFQMRSLLPWPLPHLYAHRLSTRTVRSFRLAIVAHPILVAAIRFLSVTLGTVGRLQFSPPLDGPILVKLIVANTGGILAQCLAAGVLAAIMSSLTSQFIALRPMFTQDIVRYHGYHGKLREERQVRQALRARVPSTDVRMPAACDPIDLCLGNLGADRVRWTAAHACRDPVPASVDCPRHHRFDPNCNRTLDGILCRFPRDQRSLQHRGHRTDARCGHRAGLDVGARRRVVAGSGSTRERCIVIPGLLRKAHWPAPYVGRCANFANS